MNDFDHYYLQKSSVDAYNLSRTFLDSIMTEPEPERVELKKTYTLKNDKTEEEAMTALSLTSIKLIIPLMRAKRENHELFYTYFDETFVKKTIPSKPAMRVFDPPTASEKVYYLIEKSTNYIVGYIKAECKDETGKIYEVEIHEHYKRKGLCKKMLIDYINLVPCKTYTLLNVGGIAGRKCYTHAFEQNQYNVVWESDDMTATKILHGGKKKLKSKKKRKATKRRLTKKRTSTKRKRTPTKRRRA